MELRAMLKKEIMLFARNYKSIFFLVIIPIVIVSMNIVARKNVLSSFKIGVIGTDYMEIKNILSNESEHLQYEIIKLNSIEDGINAMNKGTIQGFLVVEGKQLNIYSAGTEGSIITEILINEFQKYMSTNIQKSSPELFNKIVDLQQFNINIKNLDAKKEQRRMDNSYLAIGLVWICVYMSLSLASSQIFEERINKTIYLLIKSGIDFKSMLLGKSLAVFILICITLSIYTIFSKILLKASINISTILIAFIVIFNSLAFSYLIAILCKTMRENSFINMIVTFPAMLFTGITVQYKGIFDYIIKIFPAFHGAKLLKMSLDGYTIPHFSMIYLMITGIIFSVLSIVSLKRISKNMVVFRQSQL